MDPPGDPFSQLNVQLKLMYLGIDIVPTSVPWPIHEGYYCGNGGKKVGEALSSWIKVENTTMAQGTGRTAKINVRLKDLKQELVNISGFAGCSVSI